MSKYLYRLETKRKVYYFEIISISDHYSIYRIEYGFIFNQSQKISEANTIDEAKEICRELVDEPIISRSFQKK